MSMKVLFGIEMQASRSPSSLSSDLVIDSSWSAGNALGRIMSYDLIPLETGSVDLEGNSSWWSTECLQEAATEKSISIEKDLPLLKQLLDLDMNATLAMDVSISADPLSQDSADHNNSIVSDSSLTEFSVLLQSFRYIVPFALMSARSTQCNGDFEGSK